MLYSIKILLYIETLMVIGLLVVRALASREGARQIDARMMAVVLGLPLIGFLIPGGRYAYTAAILVGFPLLTRGRPDAARLYVTALPLMPLLTFPLTLPEPIGHLFPIGTPEILSFALLIAFLAHRRVGTFRVSLLDGAMILLWLCMAIIAVHAAVTEVTVTHVLRSFVTGALLTVLPYFLVSRSLARDEHLKLVVRALALSGLLLCIVALFEMLKRWALYDSVYLHLGIDSPPSGYRLRGGLLRARGPFVESTSFGAFLAMAGLAVAYSRGLFRSRLHHAAAILLVVGGLFATSSRGAWLAFVAGLLIVQLYRGKVGRVVAIVGLCVVAYGGARLVGSMDVRLGEVLGVSGDTLGTVDYRKDLLYNGLRQIVKRPLVGFDRLSLEVVLGNMVQGEGIIDFVNTYLAVALSAGLVGLAFFLSNFVALGAWLGQARPRLSRIRELREPTAFVVAMAGGLGAALVVQSLAERNPYWLILLFALGRSLQQALERSRKAAPGPVETAARIPAKAVSA
jgi:hypothetical protein